MKERKICVTYLAVRTVVVDRVALAAVVAGQYLRELTLQSCGQSVHVYERLHATLARHSVLEHIRAQRVVHRVFTAVPQPHPPNTPTTGPTQNRFVRFIQIFKALSCII